MNINDIVRQLSGEMGVSLDKVDEGTLREGKHLKAAAVYQGGEQYGVIAFVNGGQDLKFCMYEGKYPGLTGKDSRRGKTVNKIRLTVERDHYGGGLYRLDSLEVEFLGCFEFNLLRKNQDQYNEAESLCRELFDVEAESLKEGYDEYGFKWP